MEYRVGAFWPFLSIFYTPWKTLFFVLMVFYLGLVKKLSCSIFNYFFLLLEFIFNWWLWELSVILGFLFFQLLVGLFDAFLYFNIQFYYRRSIYYIILQNLLFFQYRQQLLRPSFHIILLFYIQNGGTSKKTETF